LALDLESAKRIRAAWTITRAIKAYLVFKNSVDGKHGETKKMMRSMKQNQLPAELMNTVIIHATIFKLQELLKMKQVKAYTLILNLMSVTKRYNYL
jgi:hypothetical protein